MEETYRMLVILLFLMMFEKKYSDLPKRGYLLPGCVENLTFRWKVVRWGLRDLLLIMISSNIIWACAMNPLNMSEFTRRINLEIYDKEELARAIEWVKINCPEGDDKNPIERQKSREEKDKDWETVIKMTMITRDLMAGNPILAETGFGEEALGHNAILSGFQGQRQWTDFMPNGNFLEAILNSSFDWNGIRQPFLVATENDSLNGVAMLFGHLLTNTAQVFADVRTYWSPERRRTSHWHPFDGSR